MTRGPSRRGLLAAALAGAGCLPTSAPTVPLTPSCGAPGDAITAQLPSSGCAPATVFVFATPSMAGDTETPAKVTSQQDGVLVFTVPAVRAGDYVVSVHCPDGEGVGSGTAHPLVVPCPGADGGATTD